MSRQLCDHGYASACVMDFASGYETASVGRACGHVANRNACEGTWSAYDYGSAFGADRYRTSQIQQVVRVWH